LIWVVNEEILGLEKIQKISGKGIEKAWKFILKIA